MRLSVIFARALLGELRRRGIDPRELSDTMQLDVSRLKDLSEMLSLEEFEELTSAVSNLTGDSSLGLSVGTSAPAHMMQIFGGLLLSQHTLRDAFGVVLRYGDLLGQGFRWSLQESDGLATLACEPDVRSSGAVHIAVECMLIMATRAVFRFVPGATPQVQLSHATPSQDDALRYQALVRCPIAFDRGVNALTLPSHQLDVRQIYGDSTTGVSLRHMADRLLGEHQEKFGLTQRLDAMLRLNQTLSGVAATTVARQFGMSVQTLRRNLKREGVQLRSALDMARYRMACDELRRPESTVAATASRLGFSEPAAFHRAFRRWTGHTPVEFVRLQDPIPKATTKASPYALARHRRRG